jgi:hypothetical protein
VAEAADREANWEATAAHRSGHEWTPVDVKKGGQAVLNAWEIHGVDAVDP